MSFFLLLFDMYNHVQSCTIMYSHVIGITYGMGGMKIHYSVSKKV